MMPVDLYDNMKRIVIVCLAYYSYHTRCLTAQTTTLGFPKSKRFCSGHAFLHFLTEHGISTFFMHFCKLFFVIYSHSSCLFHLLLTLWAETCVFLLCFTNSFETDCQSPSHRYSLMTSEFLSHINGTVVRKEVRMHWQISVLALELSSKRFLGKNELIQDIYSI